MGNNFCLLGLNHITIEVKSLEKSLKFYKNILQFKECPRPNFDFSGAWLKVDDNIQLHLIENPDFKLNIGGSRSLHFAFNVSDIKSCLDYLNQSGIEIIKKVQKRPDGYWQLYIQDPDGYFIELTSKNY